MGFSSQSNDIGRICDAVVNGIKDDVASLTTAATDDAPSTPEMMAMEVAKETRNILREIVQHLRVITNEDFRDED